MMITNNFDRMAIWQTKPMYWEPKLALFSVSQTLKKRCCFFRITVFTINVSSVYTQQGTEDFLRTFWNKATEYLILLSYGVFYSDLWCLIEHSISKMSTIIVPSCVSESHVVPIVCLFWSRELYPKWRHFFFTWNTGRTKSLFVFTHIYYHSYALNWSKSHNFSIQVTYKIILKLGFSWFWEL